MPNEQEPPQRGRKKISNACQRCRQKKIKCSGETPCQGCTERSAECIFEDVGKKTMVSERYLQQLLSTVARLQQEVDERAKTDLHPSGTGPVTGTETQISELLLHTIQQRPLPPPPPIASAPTSTLTQQPAFPTEARQFSPPLPSEIHIELVDARSAPPPVCDRREDGVEDNGDSGTPLEDMVPSIRNPLTSSEAFFQVDSSGRQRYLGSSSSLSFTWKIRYLFKKVLGDDVAINLVPLSEEETYRLASGTIRSSIFPLKSTDTDMLSRSYTKYLAETVLYHLGDIFHIFDRDVFMAKIDEFYDDGSSDQPLSTLWHVQLLLVIAFGKLFLRRGASALGPPGAVDFLRSLSLQNDALDLWADPILKIETLCLTTLYLMCCDMRATAYNFIGQAMRIALSLGMNCNVPPASLERKEYLRRRRLWWTVYIIDKKLSVIVGTPLSIRDEDIDMPLPADKDLGFSNTALKLHIKLAELEGRVMSASYRINGSVNKEFIAGIQNLFAYMAKLAESFTGDFQISLQNPSKVSRVAATLHIMYYQCTIIATRPIMFVFVKQRLSPFLNWLPGLRSVSDPVVELLKTCIGAATTILRILSILHRQDLVEPFLPFDLQSVFSAGCILTLASIAYPRIEIDKGCIAMADEILAWMCSKGNMPAKSRRQELAELQLVADKINAKPSAPPGSTSRTPSDTSSTPSQQFRWIWDAPDIDNGALSINMAASSMHLTINDALMFSFPEDIMESTDWQWPEPVTGNMGDEMETELNTMRSGLSKAVNFQAL